MTWVRRGLLPVLGTIGALLLAVLWYTSDSQVAARAHDAHLKLWQSKEPAAYTFDYAHCGGMCAGCLLGVSVRDGHVVAVEDRNGRCSGYRVQDAPTIEDVFVDIAWASSAGSTDSFEIHYDPTWGFPDSAEFRCEPGTSDCGSSYRVTSFEVLP